jgi:bifunctional non-homologous end joining protein LigD
VRPRADARVSAPLTRDELDACRPEEFTLRTMPARFAQLGDRHAGIDGRRSAGQDRTTVAVPFIPCSYACW